MDGAATGPPPLERYRDYLVLLARVHKIPQLQHRLDPSDVVQEALLRAVQNFDGYRGTTEGELRSWLRSILFNTLRDQYRAYSGPVRDIKLERSFEQALERSSARLEAWLCDTSNGTQVRMQREELLDEIARAINALPEAQRTAVELFHIHGFTLGQIAQQMGRTGKAVGALIARGVKAIRLKMTEDS